MTRLRLAAQTAVVIAAITPAALAADDVQERLEGARGVVKSFAASLRSELQQAMQAGGPTAAIEVCQISAPAIAAAQSEATGWEVGRTSLRLRNPGNAPDAWERQVLADFEARKAAGEDVAALERYETVEEDGQQSFRYMKAIPTAKPCLTCHGTAVAPEVRAKLQALYPQDQATGFALGDIRGAFTIKQPM